MTPKTLFAASAVFTLSLAGCSQSSASSETTAELPVMIEAVENANLAAVLVYADWCGSCKTLDPKLTTVKAANTFDTTNFVTLDYTAKDKAVFFSAADAAGVGDAVRAHLESGVKTGQLLLVDLDDQAVIGVVKKDMDNAAIADAIKAAQTAA